MVSRLPPSCSDHALISFTDIHPFPDTVFDSMLLKIRSHFFNRHCYPPLPYFLNYLLFAGSMLIL